jgi:hypothetical protein
MMHFFHCHAGVLQRSQLQSAFGWAAYSGSTKFNAGGRRADYGRSFGDHVKTFVLLPPDAPDDHVDPGEFLLCLTASETRVNAQEGRTLTVALPRDIPAELLPAVAAYMFVPFLNEGMAVYADIESTEASDASDNSHVHALIGQRKIGKSGFELKCRAWNRYFRKDNGRYFRAVVAGRLTLACSLLGLPICLEPRRNSERGLGDPEPRLRTTYWKRRQRGEQVNEVENLVRRRREKAAAAGLADQPKRGKSKGLTLSNVVARHMDRGAHEAALVAIERYLAGQQITFERLGDGIRIGVGSDDELFCSPGRMTAAGIVPPAIAKLLVGCARVLDWPAVVADGDADCIDSFIIAGVQEELAVVNTAASDRALSLIRHKFGERLQQAVADYDRLGVAKASVRSYRAFQFRRAMAYLPRLSSRASDDPSLQPEIRPSAAQFQKAMAYRRGLSEAAAKPLSGTLVPADHGPAVAGSLADARFRSTQSMVQFVRSMAYGPTAARAAEKAEHFLFEAVGSQTIETPSAALPYSTTGFPRLEALASKYGPGSKAPDEPELVSMPEIPAKTVDEFASQLNRQHLTRHRLNEAQKWEALEISLRKTRLYIADPEKPSRPKTK